LRDVLQIAQLAARKGSGDLTLRELAERTTREDAPPEPAPAPAAEVLDGKQPDVPS